MRQAPSIAQLKLNHTTYAAIAMKAIQSVALVDRSIVGDPAGAAHKVAAEYCT
jgi:hypothetical protein